MTHKYNNDYYVRILSACFLIDVPIMKPRRQDSTSGATGQFTKSRVQADSGDDLDEVQVGSSDAQDKVTELTQHIIEVIYVITFSNFLSCFKIYNRNTSQTLYLYQSTVSTTLLKHKCTSY